MIYSVTGYVKDVMPGAVALENNGVAFLVNVPDNSYAVIAPPGERITLYTAMMVREDDISLYGFTDKESLAMFRLLMTVQGIGARGALAVLSTGAVGEIKRAIVFEDYAFIQRANGIGKKTAQRVIMELKEKVDSVGIPAELAASVPSGGEDPLKQEAADALMALGYTKSEAVSALVGVNADSVEGYIAGALRNR